MRKYILVALDLAYTEYLVADGRLQSNEEDPADLLESRLYY
jgi:hypothetical protein